MEKESETSALQPGELELFIQSMDRWQIEQIGTSSWIDWHERLQKLNQQAVVEASTLEEEQTKEALISFGKLPILVHEAICIYVWRLKIYPQLMKLKPDPSNTFTIYMTLYHEAAAVGLLETVLYHEDSAHCLSDVIIDLIDYAEEQITALIVLINNGYLQPKDIFKITEENLDQELQRQKDDLQFDIGMRCISIIRYICEHMDLECYGASVARRVYSTHDTPTILAHLIELRPWTKRDTKGDTLTFVYGCWVRPSEEDHGVLHRVEAQVWLALRTLLLDPKLQQYYKMDSVRKATFCKLQVQHMSEELIDQLPPLGELKLWLCRLGVMDPDSMYGPVGRKTDPGSLLIEVVPEIKESYMTSVHKRCKTIARLHLDRFTSCDLRSLASRLTNVYENAIDMETKCGTCGDPASKKCGKCGIEWYCGRECQVKSWPKHRAICEQFSQISK